MPSQLHLLFGFGPPRAFGARARNGRNLVKAASVDSPDPRSFFYGSVVRGGDYVTVGKTSIPDNYVATMDSAGIVTLVAHGDKSRQEVDAELYSRRLQMWTGDSRQFLNNHAPTGTLTTLSLTIGVPMLPLVALTLFTDIDNDDLTLEGVTGTQIPGTQYQNGFISGTPNALGSGSLTFLARDPGNLVGSARVNWTVSPSAAARTAGSLHEETRLKSLIGGALVG